MVRLNTLHMSQVKAHHTRLGLNFEFLVAYCVGQGYFFEEYFLDILMLKDHHIFC